MKYGNRKVIHNGIKFDSKLEFELYLAFKLLEPTVKIVELQPKVYLTDARILYKPDFLCEKDGQKFYVEAKGFETAVWKIKKRLWKFYGPARLDVFKQGCKLSEVIYPKGAEPLASRYPKSSDVSSLAKKSR